MAFSKNKTIKHVIVYVVDDDGKDEDFHFDSGDIEYEMTTYRDPPSFIVKTDFMIVGTKSYSWRDKE